MVGNLFCHADSESRYVRLSPILSLVSFRFQYCLLWFPLIITCSVILSDTNFFANTEEKSKIRPMIQLKYSHLEGANYKFIINSKYYFLQSIMERTKVWDHPFKTSANFHDFLPLAPYHRHSSKMLMKGIFDPYVLWPFDHRHMGTPLPP